MAAKKKSSKKVPVKRTSKGTNLAKAMLAVEKALRPLSDEAKRNVIKSALALYGLDAEVFEAKAEAAQQPTPEAVPVPIAETNGVTGTQTLAPPATMHPAVEA